MKKSQLKRVIKPIVEECLNEVLLEKGLLSSIISEVVKGIQPVQQPVMQQRPQAQNNKLMQQQRQELEEQKFIELNGKFWNMTAHGYQKADQLFTNIPLDND